MKKISILWLVLIQWVLAFQWLHSAWGKWFGPEFMNNIGKTLGGFASNNTYSWYANFLNTSVIPNSELFGNLIRIGELSVGIALVIGGIVLLSKNRFSPIITWIIIVSLFAGALMNLNFYLAAGWASPSTSGINTIMFLMHLILGICYFINRKELVQH